ERADWLLDGNQRQWLDERSRWRATGLPDRNRRRRARAETGSRDEIAAAGQEPQLHQFPAIETRRNERPPVPARGDHLLEAGSRHTLAEDVETHSVSPRSGRSASVSRGLPRC